MAHGPGSRPRAHRQRPAPRLRGLRRRPWNRAGGPAVGMLDGTVRLPISITPLSQLLTRFSSVVLYATYPSSHQLSPGLTARSSIAIIAFIHATLFLFPAAAIALPKPSPHEMAADIFTGFGAIVNTWVSLVFVALQFYPQYVELRRQPGAPGALSLLALGMQALVLIAMAVRWLQRLGAPTWGNQAAPATLWYQWGWLPANFLLNGIGCAILLWMYLSARRGGGVGLAGEERPLLA